MIRWCFFLQYIASFMFCVRAQRWELKNAQNVAILHFFFLIIRVHDAVGLAISWVFWLWREIFCKVPAIWQFWLHNPAMSFHTRFKKKSWVSLISMWTPHIHQKMYQPVWNVNNPFIIRNLIFSLKSSSAVSTILEGKWSKHMVTDLLAFHLPILYLRYSKNLAI